MVVAVVAVRMMQVSVNKIVNVITVRYGFMTTSGTVNVIRIVTTTLMRWCATIRIGIAHLDAVLEHCPIIGNVMHVSVVQVIDVIAMLDASVFAVRSVLMIMVFVRVTHRFSPIEVM